MVILTERQKQILSLLLTNSEGFSVKELEDHLHVSRRTVYREFNNLRSILARADLELVNEKHKYSIQGGQLALNKLKEEVQTTKEQSSMTMEQRENALVVLLLLADEPQKIIQLALELQVSEATVQNDLNVVAQSLNRYGIQLKRKKGVGIFIETVESTRRQILVGILLSEINDYDFFRYANKIDIKTDNFFLDVLPHKLLLQVKEALKQSIFSNIQLNADHQIIELILIFTVSMMRIEKGFAIEKVFSGKATLKYQGFVFHFMALMTQKNDLHISKNDVSYLADKVMDCDSEQTNFSYDNDYELAISIKVKNFVQIVSEKMHWDFQKNPDFVNRLTKHILALIQHSVTPLPNTKIKTLANLSKKFNKLYRVIEQAWKQKFPHENIPASELQLLLLYFANEYTSKQNYKNISVLIICENGIGTSAILGERLKQEIPEIKHIKLSKVSDLPNLNLRDYDLILSTLELKGFPRDYQLVSPLLLDDEVERVKNYLRAYTKKFPVTKNSKLVNANKQRHAATKLTQAAVETLFCSEIVNAVKVKLLKHNSSRIEDVIKQCLDNCDSDIVKDKKIVADKLFKRIKLTPVGIPGSNLALFHTSSKGISHCSFTIFDLENDLTLQAMDHIDIQVKRILLMLGPAMLSTAEQKVMSLVSSMIITNDDNLHLFSVGQQEQIKNAIAVQYLHELKNKL